MDNPTASTAAQRPPVSLPRVAAASAIGTAIEWYDFFIYAQAAALVLNTVFFPEAAPMTGILLSFATLGAGFVARPLGAVVFGHWGDRIGRKKTLIATLVIMGTATFAIGVLPGYHQIGLLAPVLLVVCRLLQGLAVGGEWGGAALIGIEHAPANKKTLFGSFAQLGSPIGLLLATGVFLGTGAVIGDAAMTDWGWRIPFLISIVLVPIGFLIRSKIAESPEFEEALANQESRKAPLALVLQTQVKQLLIGLGAFSAVFVTYYLMTSFMLVYATETLHMSASVSQSANLVAAVVQGTAIVVAAVAASRFNPRAIAAFSAVGLLLWSGPAFLLASTAEPVYLYVAVGVAMVFIGASYSVLAAEVAQLFSPETRYTGASLSYHFAAVLGGGLSPVVATALLDATGSVWPVAVFSGVIALAMALSCAVLARFQIGSTPKAG